jgi:D-glycero-alpha-D-manno-heptose 1-phosphate guanylyltransferase
VREAVILAGGFGTRLRELVPNLPKPMAPINGKPFLEVLLNSLEQKRFEHLVLSLGFMANFIIDHFGDQYRSMKLSYCVEDAPLATGGATRLASQQILGDHYYVINGDTFLDFDVDGVEGKWAAHREPIIVGRYVSDTGRYGRLIVQGDAVIGIAEKTTIGEGLINAGCYVFARDQLKQYPLNQSFSLESDYLPAQLSKQKFNLFICDGIFIDIGIPEDYCRAQNFFF